MNLRFLAKVGDLVQHVPRKLGFPRSDYPGGVYLVTRFMSNLDLVSIMDVRGQTWTAFREHLEIINEVG